MAAITTGVEECPQDFRWTWLKYTLLRSFDVSDGKIFSIMLRRHENRARLRIKDFFESPITDLHDWHNQILYFYKTEYEKIFYKWVYVTKKVWKPIVAPSSPPPLEPPPSPEKKGKGKPTTSGKTKRGKEKKEEERSETGDVESENEKKKRILDESSRPQSPQTVMEVGSQAECEPIFQKVKTLVKKKKIIKVLHCRSGRIIKKMGPTSPNVLVFCRKSVKPIPSFETYYEASAEFSKYICVTSLQAMKFEGSFKKHMKIMTKYVEPALSEPELRCEKFPQNLFAQCEKFCSLKELQLPYDAFFVTSSHFYQSYQRISRQLIKECTTSSLKPQPNSIKRVIEKGISSHSYTLKMVVCSPLHTIDENLANVFYNIRMKKIIKETDVLGQAEQPPACPLKCNVMNHLNGISKKMNWCLNHIESDVDIELTPWPGIEEIFNSSIEEILLKKDVIEKLERKLELIGRFIRDLLNKCRSQDPKGAGPLAEYQYWFKREDHIGPLLLTLYGSLLSKVVLILSNVKSPILDSFKEKRFALRKYYEISRDNKDYISVSIQCLEGINTAESLDEVKIIIPQFWKNLRYLWMLSGYWAVKDNIVRFIQRVAYLIVKKCIKVLEVNHFFEIPQKIAKQLAVDVIQTMECWKTSFYDEKNHIERNKWEMRWEFPVHKIFTNTDYIAKLAKDFFYISDVLKEYLEMFNRDFSNVVKDESVVDAFCQRVKSLTIPLKTADFNLYDPDNDVHWNLLIETFMRELGVIEKEYILIIDQSFKNLKSSVSASNLLLSFKISKKGSSSLSYLLKKFEFVNIQMIKEVKVVNEFIMNKLQDAPILACHSTTSGFIYWLRRLTTSFQSRYVYLNEIDDVKNTCTQGHARDCFESFEYFYSICQFTVFINWILFEKINIRDQLSQRIFTFKETLPAFSIEPEVNFYKQQKKTKMLPKYRRQTKIGNNQNKIKSRAQNNATDYTAEDKQENMDPTQFSIDQDLIKLRKLFLYFLHEEKRYLQNYPIVPTISLKKITVHESTEKKSEYRVNSDTNFKFYEISTNFNINEIFFPFISNILSKRSHMNIFDDMKDNLQNIMNALNESSSKLTTFYFSAPLQKKYYINLVQAKSKCQTQFHYYTNYPVLNGISLFSVDSSFSSVLRTTDKDSKSIYDTLWHTLTSNESFTLHNLSDMLCGPRDSVIRGISTKFKEILQDRGSLTLKNQQDIDSSKENKLLFDKTKVLDSILQQYASQRLLIEDGYLIDLNFDFKLFTVISELYEMIKLGYYLPKQFIGLGLLNRTLRNDLKSLKKIIDRYNDFLLNLTKESLLLLKKPLCRFEFLLFKGIFYYSWHTSKVELFSISLNVESLKISSLNREINYIISCLTRGLDSIKFLDWFNFEKIGSQNSVDLKGFFQEIEFERDITYKKLQNIFSSMAPLLNRLEYLVFKNYSSNNYHMSFYYMHFEKCLLKSIVANFKMSMKKFRLFLVGGEKQKVYGTLINSGRIGLSFNPQQCNFFFVRTIEKLLNRYKMLGRWVFGSCKFSPWVKSKGCEKIYMYNYLEDVVKLKTVATELLDTQKLIQTVCESLHSFILRWQHYEVLWNFDKEISSDNFFQHAFPLIRKCDSLLCYYDKFIFELESSKEFAEVFCLRIDLTRASKYILNHAIQWKNILKCKLADLARAHSSKLYSSILYMHETLMNKTKSLDGFQKVLQAMKDFNDFNSNYNTSLSLIVEIQYILSRHQLRYPEPDQKLFTEIHTLFSQTQLLMKYRVFLVKPSINVYKKRSLGLIKEFAKECQEFAELYYSQGPGTIGDDLDRGCSLLQEYQKSFDCLNARRRKMIQAEILFEHIPQSYEFFNEAYYEFRSLAIIYELYQKQKDAREQWAQTPWIYLSAQDLTTGINSYLSELNDLEDALRSLPVAQEVEKHMINFKTSIPIMVELKNDALKERHWQELMEKTDYYFEMVASKFTLKDLFSMNLHLHRATVDDIIGKAEKELSVENSLIHLKKFWTSQQIKLSSRNGLKVLDDTDSLLILLDDYIIDLERTSDSQFSQPFLPEIQEWGKKLALIRKSLYEWAVLQESLVRLMKIFVDKNLQKPFPEAFEIYYRVREEFNELVQNIRYKSSIIDQTLMPELPKKIYYLQNKLFECEGLLSTYFAKMRDQYPRLYLLQDTEIILILGTTFPENSQLIISKIFYNLDQFSIETNENSFKICGMISSEGEAFNFKNNVEVTEQILDCMKTVQTEMKFSKKYLTKMSIYSYATQNQNRLKWIQAYPCSSVMAAIGVWWTEDVENTFNKISEGDQQAMETYLDELNNQLKDLFHTVKGSLSKIDRMKFVNVILVDLHGKDVVDKLANNSVITPTDFEWESQIKFYWKKSIDTLILRQCFGVFEYGYEYSGIGSRLAVTPLTEKNYLSLIMALVGYFPAILAGPSSTGKTDTIKTLSFIFGNFCVFSCCSGTLSVDAFRNVLYAICQDGIWACFENINYLENSCLSLIGRLIDKVRKSVTGKNSSFSIDKKEIIFQGKFGLFATINPGLSSEKSNLPNSVRLLFRTVACTAPPIKEICYSILFSEGFSQAMVLSKKIERVYELANDLLPRRGHYSFGLASLKPLLMSAAEMKRNSPDMEENVVIMRAIRDSSQTKFTPEDAHIFNGLRQATFPGVDCPPISYPDLEQAVNKAWSQMGYVYIKALANKVTELYEILLNSSSALVLGPTGGGKTHIITSFIQALTILGQPAFTIKLNPRANSDSEFFGNFNANKNWTDGLFPHVFKEMNKSYENNNNNCKRYIVCDGELDHDWLDRINSILDENKILSLPNCERIPLLKNSGFIFETGHVNNVSPSTISKLGVVYVDPIYLGYKPFWTKWTLTRIDENEINLLNEYFEKYIPSLLEMVFDGKTVKNVYHPPLKTLIHRTKLNLVSQLCFALDAMFPIVEKGVLPLKSSICLDYHTNLESIFIQAIYASIGASLAFECISEFDAFVKRISGFENFDDAGGKKANLSSLPTLKNTLFDYYVDLNQECWIPWEDLVNKYTYDTTKTFDDIIVPSEHSARVIWLMSLTNKFNCKNLQFKTYKYKLRAMKKKSRPILLIAPRNSGKTTTLKEFSRTLENNKFNKINVVLSRKSSGRCILDQLQDVLIEESPCTLIPKNNKKLIVFIDDIHKPEADCFGIQETSELLKYLIENQGMFDRDFTWKTLKDVYYFSTMAISESTATIMNPRLLSQFFICGLKIPSEDTLAKIYTAILRGHTDGYVESIKINVDKIVQATMRIYKFVSENLLPVPSKFYYRFNIKDLSKTFQGLMQISPTIFETPQQYARVWRNEVTRVFSDRLFLDDQELIKKEINATILSIFPSYSNYVLRDPLLFGDYRNATQKDLTREYEDLLDYEAVYHLFTEILEEKKKISHKMNLVLFENVLDHLTRTHRILRMWRGHILFIGPIGSGKRSIIKLAAYSADSNLHQITISKKYGKAEFLQDIKKLFRDICLDNKRSTLLISSHQIINEDILEILNIIITSGSLLNVFSQNEKSEILNEIFFDLYRQLNDDKDGFLLENMVNEKCGKYFHLALLVSKVDPSWYSRYPELFDHSTINFIQPWPSQALTALAWRHVKDIDIIPDRHKETIIEVILKIHETSLIQAESPVMKSFRPSYITPSHFFNLVNIFLNMFASRYKNQQEEMVKLDSAIKKMQEATLLIEKMKNDIVIQKSAVVEKTNVTATIALEINDASERLMIERKYHSDKIQEIDALKIEINQQMCEIQTVLSRAVREIEKSQESIRILDVKDINMLSQLEEPSDLTTIIFESVLALLGESPIDWPEVRKMLCDPLFFYNLEKINLNKISLLQQKLVRARLKKIEKIQEIPETGSVESAFLSFVESVLGYCSAFRETKPKQEKVSELEFDLRQEEEKLNRLNIRIDEIERELEKLNSKLGLAESDFKSAEDELVLTQEKLEAADNLLLGLSDDNKRWQEKLSNLQKIKNRIIGNSLVCSGFLAYCGTFLWEERAELTSIWINETKLRRIPISTTFQLETEFADEVLLSRWRHEGLPSTDWTVQNAILMTFSKLYPFCIDPEGQAVEWIMKKENKNNLSVLNFENEGIIEIFRELLFTGRPILIKNAENIDVFTLELLENEIFEMKTVLNNVFLYLATSVEKPNLDPCIFSYTNVINFSKTKDELNEYLHDICLQNIHHDVWNQWKKSLEEDYISKYENHCLTENLFEIVVKSSFLLSQESLLELQKIKAGLEKIQEKNAACRKSLIELEEHKNQYKELAGTGAVLFGALRSQCCINQFNTISLPLFVKLFLICLNENQEFFIKGSMKEAVTSLKKYFYNYCRAGVFPSQENLVSFILAFELEKSEGNSNDEALKFFIFGGNTDSKFSDAPPSPYEWLAQKDWQQVQALCKQFSDEFSGLIEHMMSNKTDWEKWFKLPGSEKLMLPFSKGLRQFQKLMILKILCVEYVPMNIRFYIEEVFGFDDGQFHNSGKYILEKCRSDIPAVLIETQGSDPYRSVAIAAKSCGMETSIKSFVMGGHNHMEAILLLNEAIKTGFWAVFINCHLEYELIGEIMSQFKSADFVHKNFRLWLISEPAINLPRKILRNSIKVVIGCPDDFKSKLLQTYEHIDDNFLETCDYNSFKRIVYSTCLFHSVLQERRKLGWRKWNSSSNFGYHDLYYALELINCSLTDAFRINLKSTPWQLIKFLLSEVAYGGCITNANDKGLMKVYLDEYFDDFIFSVNNIYTFFSDGSLNSQDYSEDNKEDFIEGISNIKIELPSKIFGLQKYQEILYYQNVAKKMSGQLKDIYFNSGPVLKTNKDEEIRQKANDIICKIPEKCISSKIKATTLGKNYFGPLTDVLLQELELFNVLIDKIKKSLLLLDKALTGKLEMGGWLMELGENIYDNKLPFAWEKLSPKTSNDLSTWILHLQKRSDQYISWCREGNLAVIWLGGLCRPKSYLASHLQLEAQNSGCEIENLTLKTYVTDKFQHEEFKDLDHPGCYLSGIFMKGAQWDSEKHSLMPMDYGKLLYPLPLLRISLTENFHFMLKNRLKIPIYEKNGEIPILEAEIETTPIHLSKWILQGVIMILNED